MNYPTKLVPAGDITRLIRSIREQRVILDNDLAAIYQVPTKRLTVSPQPGALPARFRLPA